MATSYSLNLRISEAEAAVKEAVEAGLIACGITLEGQIVKNITQSKLVDEGRLRSSITYKTKTQKGTSDLNSVPNDNEVIIGTNLKYAPYVEFGTGIFAEGGGGRKTPWIYYYDGHKGKKGFRFTRGMKPQAFMRKAFDQWRNKMQQVFSVSFKKVMDSKK